MPGPARNSVREKPQTIIKSRRNIGVRTSFKFLTLEKSAAVMAQTEEDFATTFNIAVHGGLDKVLGQSGAQAVLLHMKMAHGLPDPVEFHKKLLALFGPPATLSLERAIVKDLAQRLKWSLEVLSIEGAFDFNATMRAVEKGAKV
jgi:hypothetical protein